MKARIKCGKNIEIEVEAENVRDLHPKIASVQEVYGEPFCGNCRKDNLYCRTRIIDENSYHELVCRDCGHCLSFGSHKKSPTLFPKRLVNGVYDTAKHGWHKWTPPVNDEE